jgi:S-adenosylmethionine hydrolase
MGTVITLTTDFGTSDAYVAAMKGVILGINPEARLVDICHTIEPQNIAQAAYILGTVYEFFPRRSIHVVVVDPGVGTGRKPVILRTPEADFMAPDNGVLSYVIEKYSIQPVDSRQAKLDTTKAAAIHLTESKFWLEEVRPTFHGRDIFAPVAAHLSLGTQPGEFGEAVDSLVVLPSLKPRRESDGTIMGQVLHIDRFGNLITSIKESDLPGNTEELIIDINGRQINGIVKTYADSGDLCALIGSSGYLEIALPDGSAADITGASAGDAVRVRTP